MKRLDFARDQQWEPLPYLEPNRIGDYVEYEEVMEEVARLTAERDDYRTRWARLNGKYGDATLMHQELNLINREIAHRAELEAKPL